jgi:hypothetical protein
MFLFTTSPHIQNPAATYGLAILFSIRDFLFLIVIMISSLVILRYLRLYWHAFSPITAIQHRPMRIQNRSEGPEHIAIYPPRKLTKYCHLNGPSKAYNFLSTVPDNAPFPCPHRRLAGQSPILLR